jgi:hypothetical protein
MVLPVSPGDGKIRDPNPWGLGLGSKFPNRAWVIDLSHRLSFDTGRNSRQLSPYNFVWETLKRLDRATPATTLVIAFSL